MAAYRLSRSAVLDLDGIYEYTSLNFGLSQAQMYLNGLHESLANLAEQPMLGRTANQVAANLRRYHYRSHVVFYLLEEEYILVVRVLHQSMDLPRHVTDDDQNV